MLKKEVMQLSALMPGDNISAETVRQPVWRDRIFSWCSHLSALSVLLTLSAILISLMVGAWPAIHKFGFGFLSSSEWNPVTEQFGAAVPIFGTLVTSLIAMLIGIPVSFGIALFITELCPNWLKRPLGIAIELLAAIPSIIYGMWGLFVFAPLFADHIQPWVTEHLGGWPLIGALLQGPPLGIGMFTAGLILSIMVIPFMASVMRDIFEVVPAVLKESAYGVGATTWEVTRHVILPYTKVGVVGGIMLGLGRAMGETMAVTFVIGNADNISSSLFMPGNTISSSIANQFTEAVGEMYTSSLIELGLILFFVSFVVLSLSKLLLLRMAAGEGKHT